MSHVQKNERYNGTLFTGLRQLFRVELERTVPAHTNFLHYLGALVFIFFCFQIITGILLMVYYRPSADAAHHSMVVIMDEVRLGWLVRSLHSWGSDLLIVLAILHMARVYFAHAYEAPRQLNWIAGVVLLLALLAFAFTGTLLPWDQYAYWSTYSAREIVAGIPLLGKILLDLLWGGREIGEEALLRFYVFHAGVLPWITVSFLFLHLFMIWRLGIREPSSVKESSDAFPTPFFPDFLLNLLIAVLIFLGVLISAAVLLPRVFLAEADPITVLGGVKPKWYFLPLHELLRHLSGGVTALVVSTFVLLLFLVPFLDRRPAPSMGRKVFLWALGLLAIASVSFLGVRGYLFP
jgi:quinol-cytochrome oxidoreductase complex cytochrome b subunit